MKHLARLGLAAAIGMAVAGTALATPIELTAFSGTGPGTSVLVPNTGGGNLVSYSNSDLNGWDIKIALGISDSPSLTGGGLDLTTDANCLTTCNPLTIAISDVGFTAPVGPNDLVTGLSDTSLGNPATISQWAYMDTADTYFGSSDPTASSDFYHGVYDPSTASLIGMVTVNGPGGVSSSGGGSGSTGPYSLTLVDQFCSDPAGAGGTCTGGVAFSSDGGITAPEPGGLALFGAGLLGFALFAGRRRSSKARA